MRTLFCKIVICCSVLGQDYLHHLSEEIQKPLLEMQKRSSLILMKHELSKGTIDIDMAIPSDAKEFLSKILEVDLKGLPNWSEWISKCEEWKEMFPSDSYDGFCLKEFSPEKDKIYPFQLMKIISNKLPKLSTIVSDGGATLIYTLQALRLKQGQRLISSTGVRTAWLCNKRVNRGLFCQQV